MWATIEFYTHLMPGYFMVTHMICGAVVRGGILELELSFLQ